MLLDVDNLFKEIWIVRASIGQQIIGVIWADKMNQEVEIGFESSWIKCLIYSIKEGSYFFSMII
jgi:hypothetical protein